MSFYMYVPTRMVFGCGQLKNMNKYEMPGKKP